MAKTTLTAFGQKVKQWEKRYPNAIYKGLQQAVPVVTKEAKKFAGSSLTVRTGQLVNSIAGITSKKPLGGLIRINKKSQYPKGIHERGGVITAKRKPYLTFQVGGQWVKVKSVTIPPRPFLAPAVDATHKEVARIIGSVLKRAVFDVK